MRVCAYIYTYIHIYIYTYIHITYIHIYIYTYIHIYIYIYIYMYYVMLYIYIVLYIFRYIYNYAYGPPPPPPLPRRCRESATNPPALRLLVHDPGLTLGFEVPRRPYTYIGRSLHSHFFRPFTDTPQDDVSNDENDEIHFCLNTLSLIWARVLISFMLSQIKAPAIRT